MILEIIGFTSLYIFLIVWCCCEPVERYENENNSENENTRENENPPTVIATTINQL